MEIAPWTVLGQCVNGVYFALTSDVSCECFISSKTLNALIYHPRNLQSV